MATAYKHNPAIEPVLIIEGGKKMPAKKSGGSQSKNRQQSTAKKGGGKKKNPAPTQNASGKKKSKRAKKNPRDFRGQARGLMSGAKEFGLGVGAAYALNKGVNIALDKLPTGNRPLVKGGVKGVIAFGLYYFEPLGKTYSRPLAFITGVAALAAVADPVIDPIVDDLPFVGAGAQQKQLSGSTDDFNDTDQEWIHEPAQERMRIVG